MALIELVRTDKVSTCLNSQPSGEYQAIDFTTKEKIRGDITVDLENNIVWSCVVLV